MSRHEVRVAHSRAAREVKVMRSLSDVSTYIAPADDPSASAECAFAGDNDDAACGRRGGGDSQAISSYMSEAPEVSLQTEPDRRDQSDSRRGSDRLRMSDRRRWAGAPSMSYLRPVYL